MLPVKFSFSVMSSSKNPSISDPLLDLVGGSATELASTEYEDTLIEAGLEEL